MTSIVTIPSLKPRDYLPLVIALFTTFLVVLIIEKGVLGSTGGVFMYPLDDPFIHMQLAKNLAFHHTWGINPGEFASASSSLLYTLLLALLFKIFSVNVIIPFLVNCVAGVLLLHVVHKWLWKQQVKAMGRTVILLLLVVFVPLPVMIISGMEHTLQCLFSFLFLIQFSDWLSATKEGAQDARQRLPVSVLLYAMLTVLIRYEGLFIIAIACLLLLLNKKIIHAFLLGFVSLLPLIIFGVYSMNKGSYFLPNSVLVKSTDISFSAHGLMEFFNTTLVNKLTLVKPLPGASPATPPPGISLLVTQRLLIILPLLYLFFFDKIRAKRSWLYPLTLLMLTTVLHLCFAATGWFYRYEAYLVLPAILFISVLLYQYGRSVWEGKWKYAAIAMIILSFGLFFPFLLRSAAGFSNAKQACINIYQQQYQMGQFVKQYHSSDAVALNDIGAVSYYSNAPVTDLWGLGSIDVAKSKKKNYWTPAFLDSFVNKRNVKLAMVYDKWFNPGLLQRWTKVGSWRIYNNVICGDDSVSFYAIHPVDTTLIKRNLIDYQGKLPQQVSVRY